MLKATATGLENLQTRFSFHSEYAAAEVNVQ
jgi:hypothetical protein